MSTDAENYEKIIKLLRGGHAMDAEGRSKIITDLNDEERLVLREIARGEREVEHPKLRQKAVIALGFDQSDVSGSQQILLEILADKDPSLQINTLRTLSRISSPEIIQRARNLVVDTETRPDVALAAARLAVQGGVEVVVELQGLRARFLPLVNSEHSPSIVSLDKLIQTAEGNIPPSPSSDELGPIV